MVEAVKAETTRVEARATVTRQPRAAMVEEAATTVATATATAAEAVAVAEEKGRAEAETAAG